MAFEFTLQIDPSQFAPRIREALKRAMSQAEVNSLANFAKNTIISRTRAGFGVAQVNGNESRLAALSQSYRRFRRTPRADLDSTTSPDRSNLTRTGDMLRSLKCTVSGTDFNKTFRIEGRDRFTQNKINWAHEGSSNRPARPFLYLSKNEINELRAEFRESFRKYFSS